jgi:hypothetical protein
LALAERQIPASMAGATPAAAVSNGKRGSYYMKAVIYIFIVFDFL